MRAFRHQAPQDDATIKSCCTATATLDGSFPMGQVVAGELTIPHLFTETGQGNVSPWGVRRPDRRLVRHNSRT